MSAWMSELLAIVILLVVVALVITRLPKIDLGHDPGFRRRRVWNWLPLGITYALNYMGRYNLTVSKGAFEEIAKGTGGSLMGNTDFGVIFGVGTVVYGVSFLLNGPLTDRYGGRKAMLVCTGGAVLMNVLMGLVTWSLLTQGPLCVFLARSFLPVFTVLYALNMYFQSFGAVAIVKVNAAWFHVRERGVFGAIFGILISLGIYFAFDLGRLILKEMGLVWVFMMPALLMAVFWLIDLWIVRDKPSDTGHLDFDTADATSGESGPPLGPVKVFKMMLSNPVIMTIALIEFCSGFLRHAIMQWYLIFTKQTDAALHLSAGFVNAHWGMLQCCAGILGGVLAGTVSDHVFQSRRGPVAAVLYGVMLVGAGVLVFTYQTPGVGWLMVVMLMAVIGVHGMLSGTASMDFGGSRNAGMAVGIIDGFVYLGTAVMSLTYAKLLPEDQLDAAGKIVGPATDPANWRAWPLAMVPLAAIGLVLATRVWNAKPRPGGAAH